MVHYHIIKIKPNGTELDYGTYGEEDKDLILQGWKFNGMFHEKKGVKSIIIVKEIKQ